jgi:hypothetical protein
MKQYLLLYACLMNRQKMKFCFTPEGVTWSSTTASTKLKLSPSSLCKVSGLYLTTESPLHFGGASRPKVAMIRCPFSFKAWLSEFMYPFLSSASVRTGSRMQFSQKLSCLSRNFLYRVNHYIFTDNLSFWSLTA